MWRKIPIVHFINLAMILLLFAYSVGVYDLLPKQIPVHFNIAGTPDRFSELSWVTWLLLPIIATAVTALFYSLTLILPLAARNPRYLNIPAKDEFVSLDEKQRLPVLVTMAMFFHWMPVPMNILFFWLQREIFQVAMNNKSTLAAGTAFLLFFLVLFAMIALTYLAVSRTVRKAAIEARNAERESRP
jgi:uncharacterized membrane protein